MSCVVRWLVCTSATNDRDRYNRDATTATATTMHRRRGLGEALTARSTPGMNGRTLLCPLPWGRGH